MAEVRAWRQQYNSSESELGPTAHHPRSLTSMLADSLRVQQPPDSIIVKTIEQVPRENELEGESEFIALSQDFAPLFQARMLSSPVRRVDSSRELLTDLFPTGFTSNTLSPLATAAAATMEAEPELKGRQVWACLMAKTAPATTVAVASSNSASDVGTETEQRQTPENAREKQHMPQSPLHPVGPSYNLYGCSERHQPKFDELESSKTIERDAIAGFTGLGSSSAKTITATRADLRAPSAVAPNPRTTRRKSCFISDVRGHGFIPKTETAEFARREREIDLKHALDRLVLRLMQSQERVKFLEGNLEQAKHAESGRNALIKQITTLEEEVKHARHRLEIRHAEALEWREKRQSLEADNERLGAELHRALGRNSRLETENRRKDALLAEVRKSADSRAEKSSTFEAELRHKNQLLLAAERDKKQAWQATSASAEMAKAAIKRAEAAVKEASDLHFLRSDAGGKNVKRTDENVGFAVEVEQSGRRHGQSLTDVIMAATAAGGGNSEPEKTRHSSCPTEASLLQSTPLAERYGDERLTRYLSPETGRSVDRPVAPPNEPVSRVRNKLGPGSTSDSDEGLGFGIKSNGSTRVLPPRPPQATATTTDSRTPRTVFFDDGRSDNRLLPPSKETQEPTTNASLTPGSRRRVSAAETPPRAARATGREQCIDGDRQRHDSEGVKGALTGANPAWTDGTSSFGGGSSSTAVAGSRSSGGGAAGGEEFAQNIHSAGRGGDGCRPGDETHCRSKDCGNHAETFSIAVDGRVADEMGPRIEGDGTPAAEESSTLPKGWELQQVSPRCPAAGHRRGRDMMSSRRSSLSGAGVGVSAGVAGEASITMSPFSTGGKSEDRTVVVLSAGDAFGSHHGGAGDDGPVSRQQNTGDDVQEYGKPPSIVPPTSAADSTALADHGRRAASGGMSASEPDPRRKSTGGVQRPTSSVKSTQRAESLASLFENADPPCDSGTEEISRREKRVSAPFATDAAEDELRPVREVERRLMLLQMETSKLEAEQSKLMPKASKTMQARAQLQKIDSRLALLASESSGLRRVLREKPWRM